MASVTFNGFSDSGVNAKQLGVTASDLNVRERSQLVFRTMRAVPSGTRLHAYMFFPVTFSLLVTSWPRAGGEAPQP